MPFKVKKRGGIPQKCSTELGALEMMRCGQLHTEQPEPRVGIFWLLDGRVIIDSTPLSMTEHYGTALTHPASHIDHWTSLQRNREVPGELEYEMPPRGRVVYDQRERRFHLYADRCILRRRDVGAGIMEAMHLPDDTALATDDHYRCFRCLQEIFNREEGRDEPSTE